MKKSKKTSLFKKVSLLLCSITLLCILGAFNGFIKHTSARPSCGCPNPNIEIVYHEKGYTRYHCTNCGWWYTIKK